MYAFSHCTVGYVPLNYLMHEYVLLLNTFKFKYSNTSNLYLLNIFFNVVKSSTFIFSENEVYDDIDAASGTHTHTHIYIYLMVSSHQKRVYFVLFVIIIANLIYCLFVCLLTGRYIWQWWQLTCLKMMDIIHVKVSSPEKGKRDWTPSNEGLTWFEDVFFWKTFTFTFMYLADTFIQGDLHCIQVTVLHFISSFIKTKAQSFVYCRNNYYGTL